MKPANVVPDGLLARCRRTGRLRELRPWSRFLVLALAAGLVLVGSGCGTTGANLLYVQNAPEVAFEGSTLVLKRVGANTIFFSDRPERIAGHEMTEEFVTAWDVGEDSFSENPPNATLSVLDGTEVTSVVMVLTAPRLEGGDLRYETKILEGTPQSGGPSSLFIDSHHIHVRHHAHFRHSRMRHYGRRHHRYR